MSIVFPSPPQSHFYWFPSTAADTTTKLLLFPLFHHHHIPIVFPPPPHFYLCPSITTNTIITFRLFSLHHQYYHICIVFRPPPHLYCLSARQVTLMARESFSLILPWFWPLLPGFGFFGLLEDITHSKGKTFIDLEITRKAVQLVKPPKNSILGFHSILFMR